MADEARVSGIKWRETFPFTHIFRSFRIAIHPSKLALGLLALIFLYVGGRVLDAVWPVQYLAVRDEPSLFQDYGNKGGNNAAFHERRMAARSEVETLYAAQLAEFGLET